MTYDSWKLATPPEYEFLGEEPQDMPLTPAEIIADIKALDRIRNDWSAEGRLDGDTEKYLADKRADLMDSLRELDPELSRGNP